MMIDNSYDDSNEDNDGVDDDTYNGGDNDCDYY